MDGFTIFLIVLILGAVLYAFYQRAKRLDQERLAEIRARRELQQAQERAFEEKIKQHVQSGWQALKERGPRLYVRNHLVLCIDQKKRGREPFTFPDGHYWVVLDGSKPAPVWGDIPREDICYSSSAFPGPPHGYKSLVDALPHLDYDDYVHGGRQLMVPDPKTVRLCPDGYWTCSLWDVS